MAVAVRSVRSRQARVLPGLAVCVLGLLSLAFGATPPDHVTEVVVSTKGFRPATLNARKGEVLHVRLSTSDHEHCFAIDELRVEKRVVPGRVTSVDVTPDQTGRFAFYCCLENGSDVERGTLVVTE